jgi:hypothetical protein
MTSWGVLNTRNLKFDFANFYDAGRRAAAGEFATLYDAKAPIAGQEPFGGMSFYSAPLTSFLFVPMAGLPPFTATFLFKLAGAVAQLAGLWLLWHRAARLSPSDDRSRAVFAALAAVTILGFQPVYSWMFVGGQTTPFVFLFIVLGWIAFLREGHVAAALALSAAVVIKPAFAPLAFVVFVCAPWRFRVAALVTGGAFLALSVALLGIDVHRAFLQMILGKSVDVNAAWQNSNPFSWVEPLLPDPAGGVAVRVLQLSAVAGVALWLVAALLRDGPLPARRHAVWSAGILIALTLSPVVWTHYLIALLIPALPLLAQRRYLPTTMLMPAAGLGLLALSAVQNKLVMDKIAAFVSLDDWRAVAVIAFAKSLPMMAALATLLLAAASLAAMLRDPSWAALGDSPGSRQGGA